MANAVIVLKGGAAGKVTASALEEAAQKRFPHRNTRRCAATSTPIVANSVVRATCRRGVSDVASGESGTRTSAISPSGTR